MPLILPGNVATATAATGYDVANSVRMNDGDTPYFNKTPSAGDRAKWTFSCWFKLGNIPGASSTHGILVSGGASADQSTIRIDGQVIDWVEWDQSGSATQGRLITNRVFRDPTAWYHLVCTWDSDNGTEGSRMKMYINGVRETSFSTGTYPTSGYDSAMNSNVLHEIGRQSWNSSQYFDGYFAEMAFCDGQAYAASDFGEFNSDSPTIWQPKDISGLTFGSRGWYLDFEDSGDLDDDESGNGNDWTANNLAAADQAVDTPTNNFCTLNPLHSMAQSSSTNNTTTYSEGNCKLAPSDNNSMVHSSNTIAMPPNGKWYMELKFLSTNVSYGGIIDIDKVGNASRANVDLSSSGTSGYNSVVYQTNYIYAGTSSSYGDDIENNDIMGIAFDADNGALYIALNGTWQNSGDPTSGASKTNAIDISGQSWYAGVTGWSICIGDGSTSNGDNYEVSFGGCPGFTVSSAQADDNGYGIFEHDVPAGYYAICTKNLAEFGG